MRKAISFLFGIAGPTDRTTASDWWAYLGAFGDDIFGDDFFPPAS